MTTAPGCYPPPLDGWPKTPSHTRSGWQGAEPPLTGPDDPRHGQPAGYRAGCRDDCCMAPIRRRKKLARVAAERFGPAYAPSEQAEAVALRWAQYGIGPTALCDAAGLRESALMHTLHHGSRIKRSTLDAIRAVTWDDLDDRVLVYPELMRARIRSLQAAGFPLAYVLERVPRLPRGGRWRKSERVSLGVARGVQAVYEAAPLQGPSEYVRKRAVNAGYLHPLAWDDPGTPAAPYGWRWEAARGARERVKERLDMAVVWRRLNGDRVPMSRRERIEVVRIARDENGWTERLIRDVTGIAQAWDRKRYPKREEGAEDATGVA